MVWYLKCPSNGIALLNHMVWHEKTDMTHTMRTSAKIFLHFSEMSFAAFLRARWRHWKVKRPRCISSPWEKLLQKRHLQILHDIHQREWYMIRGSLVFSFDISSLVLFDKNWIFLDLSILFTHPLESWSIHPFVFLNFLEHLFGPQKKSLHTEDHCLATTCRRVGRRTGPRMKRWSNSCHHLPLITPAETNYQLNAEEVRWGFSLWGCVVCFQG